MEYKQVLLFLSWGRIGGSEGKIILPEKGLAKADVWKFKTIWNKM